MPVMPPAALVLMSVLALLQAPLRPPIVQSIDNYERAYRLGIVFELAVGKGRLLVCSIDLPALQERPEARQLLHSLLAYMRSDGFAPKTTADAPTLRRLLE